jgi:threonine dehydrogenase-like Zn-dependent dehydrogenase
VLGLGPIGQFAARIAKHLGVERVIGVDPVPERRAAAARFGVETLDPSQTADTASTLIDMTGGRGPDSVIDAVGMEAHGHDEAAASKLAETAQRATGLLPDRLAQKITEIAAVDRLDALHAAVKAVRRGGTVSVSGGSDPLGVVGFATHHLPLEQAPHGYEIFRNKDDGCIKVVLQP